MPDSPTLSRTRLPDELRIDVRPSGRAIAAICGWLALVCAGLMALWPVFWAYRALACLVALSVAASGLTTLIGRRRIVSVRRTRDGTWYVRPAGGTERPATLIPNAAVVGTWLWLTWRTRNARYPVVFDPAAIDAASLRALRRTLRLDRRDLGRSADNNW